MQGVLKVFGFFITTLGLALVLSLSVFYWNKKALPRDPATGKLNIKINPWLLTLVILGVSLLMVRYIDHRPLQSLGLHFYFSWWLELALGIIIGCAMLIVMALMLRILTKKSPKPLLAKFVKVLEHLRGAIGEELAVRGYPLQTLIEAVGIYPAVFTTSLFFGLLHFQNQRWLGAVAASLAGLLLATVVLKTNALWMAIGLHFGWNFLESLLGLGGENSRQRYLIEIIVIIVFWILLMMLPIQPHSEMEGLWREYILRP